MPVYAYRARDWGGGLHEGTIEADSWRAVVQQLRERSHMLTGLRERVMAPSVGEQVRGIAGVPRAYMVLFTRQLATMVGAGLPLITGLEVTARQTENRRLREVLEAVRAGIEAGGTLSGELAKYPTVFSSLYVNTVRAGEAAGSLDRVLDYLADYVERDMELIQRIKTAAAYPTVVMFLAIGVGILSVFVVLPVVTNLFDSIKVALPLPTQILIAFSKGAQHYWWAAIAGVVGLFFTILMLRRTRWGARIVDAILLRIPVIGHLVLKVAVARFTRVLAMIIRSGVPIVQGMEVIARASGNALVSEAIENCAAGVREGESIAASLSKSPMFPPMLWQMVTVGEQTGALEEILDKIADFYDREVSNTVGRFAAILEPMMIVTVGGIVAFVAVSILLPLWKLIGAIH